MKDGKDHHIKKEKKKIQIRAFLVAQGLGIHLPILGMQVRSLIQEDSTCHGAAKPRGHN